MIFPLKRYLKPISFLNVEIAKFGARRGISEISKTMRFHAGSDIYTFQDEPVLAIADGTIFECTHKFYYNVGSVAIKHKNSIIRYGELEPIAGLKVGDKVFEGQVIGYAKQIYKDEVTKMNVPVMIHLEEYTDENNKNTLSDLSKEGYQRGFARRIDLTDSTKLLKMLLGIK